MGDNRSGPSCEVGRNKSGLVKIRSKLGQIEPNVPRNTTIAREELNREALRSWEFSDGKRGSMVGRLKVVGAPKGRLSGHSEKRSSKCVNNSRSI